MSQPSGKPIYIPPFSGVRLIECRDHFELVPVPEVRTVFGYGKIKASEFRIDPDDPKSEQVWGDRGPGEEIWAVMQWYVYSDAEMGVRLEVDTEMGMGFLRPLNQVEEEEFATAGYAPLPKIIPQRVLGYPYQAAHIN